MHTASARCTKQLPLTGSWAYRYERVKKTESSHRITPSVQSRIDCAIVRYQASERSANIANLDQVRFSYLTERGCGRLRSE